MNRIIGYSLSLGALLIGHSLYPAQAQSPASCAPRDTVLRHLETEFGELPIWRGLSDGRVMEIVSNPDGSSWTALMSLPNGMTCLFATGEAAESVKPEPRKPPEMPL